MVFYKIRFLLGFSISGFPPEELRAGCSRRRRQLSALGKMSANEAHGTGKHWINSIFPAPESFYDQETSLKLGRPAYFASPAAVASYSLLLYSLSGGVFAALLGFYSHPSQYLSETIVQSSWSRPGFECAPLQNDPHYGVNYSYTECLANVVAPSATSLTLGSTESVSQTGYERTGGYTCTPSQNDPHYDVSYTYTECLANVVEPSATSVSLVSSVWKYTPLGNSRGIKSTESTVGIRARNDTIKNVTSQVVLGHGTEIAVTQAGWERRWPYIPACPEWTQASEYVCTYRSWGSNYYDGECECHTPFGSTIDQNEAIEIYTYITNQLGDSICDFAKTNSPFQCTRRCYNYRPFSSSSVATPETLLTSAESTCNSGGAERCSSQSEATDYFKCQRTSIGDSICDFTKTNSPFQCTRKQPIEVMQRISLSYAGAILVYSGLSVFFSWLMQYRKARIEKLRKVVASKGIVLTPENQEPTV